MKSNINQEIRELSIDQLKLKIDDWRRQLLSLRLSSVSSHVKDYSQFKKNKLIRKKGLIIPDRVNNYGMVLKDL